MQTLFLWALLWYKKELLKGTYNLIPSLPSDIINERSPGLFCLIGSVACRHTSSSMITFSDSTSQYSENLPRGPFDTADRDQYPSVTIFPL